MLKGGKRKSAQKGGALFTLTAIAVAAGNKPTAQAAAAEPAES